MAKTGKGLKQPRNNVDQPKSKAVSETIKPQPAEEPKSGTATVWSTAAEKQAPASGKPVTPVKQSFDLNAYVRSFAWVYPVVLIALMVFMAWVRTSASYDDVFTSWSGNYINVAQDDAVMQMRLVYNTLAHYPVRIMFDPFTHYPYGSNVHFGPLFTLTIATAALIAGLGSPSAALVSTVGAYVPVIMGALCLLPVYFIGRKLYGRNAGIVAAATLALLPGQFLGRSMLGFTDHHIAEVLFSAATVMFLVFALEAAKKSGLSLAKLQSRDREALKGFAYAALAGVAFGCYMLNWPGALLLGFMLFVYFTAQAIINHMRGESLDYILIVAALLYLPPAIMVLPWSLQDTSLQLVFYSMTQPLFLCLALGGVGVIYAISSLLRQNKAEGWTFPVTLGGIALVGLLVAYLLLPQLYDMIIMGFSVFVPQGGMLTVAEAMPTIFERGTSGNYDVLSTDALWYGFYWTIAISFVAILMLAFRVLKDNRPAELLFLVWNLVMLWATLSQIRFTYYFAINAALLTGYFAISIFRAFDSTKYVEQFKARVKKMDDVGEFLGKHVGQTLVFAILSVVFLLIIAFPVTSLSLQPGMDEKYSQSFVGGMLMAQADGGPGMPFEWYDALTWLRDHSPDPQGTTVQAGFDYADGTYSKDLWSNGTYKYPASAYGVMSWWDYGHIIEYVAHRIPNANPFQAGIIENNGTDGSAKFFLATDEKDGYRNLQDMGSRYVMIDNQMAEGKFGAIQRWVDDTSYWYAQQVYNMTASYQIPLLVDSPKYKSSMMSRLYYDDCIGMEHFRLVYESPGGYYVSTKLADLRVQTDGSYAYFTDRYFIPSENYTQMFNLYANTVYPAALSADSMEQFFYDSRPPVKFVKTYEVVKGATLAGTAPANSSVTATLPLGIANRTFNYQQTVTAGADGTYRITVPYASEAMQGAGYASDVSPRGQYTIKCGNATANVTVPERAVVNGETVTVGGLQG